jgi:hypothetical protein
MLLELRQVRIESQILACDHLGDEDDLGVCPCSTTWRNASTSRRTLDRMRSTKAEVP